MTHSLHLLTTLGLRMGAAKQFDDSQQMLDSLLSLCCVKFEKKGGMLDNYILYWLQC